MMSQSSNQAARVLLLTTIATGMLSMSSLVHAVAAQPYVSQAPSALPAPGTAIPGPANVPGKEYSSNLDEDSLGAADPLQILEWDGVGGVRDGLDFGMEGEADALSNHLDALFYEVSANTSALLFSVSGDGNIYSESVGGAGAVWAAPLAINAMHPPGDVDGLEIWGDDAAGDTNRGSLVGDPFGISIFDELLGAIATTADIAGAIGRPDLEIDIDLDGLMFQETSPTTFDIMFSIAPIAGAFDGGEIWTWGGPGAAAAAFLVHGGHVWNTAFDVMGTFGLASENINALEASSEVPLPAAAWLFGSGLVGLFGIARRRRVTA